MGLNQITNLTVKYSDDFINACSKSKGFISKTFQKSASIFPEKIDQSISPVFLESLRNVEGNDAIDKITKIKDLIMKAMGFKHPEVLEVLYDDYSRSVTSAGNFDAGFCTLRNKLIIGENLFNDSLEVIIAMLRHELDHVEKYTKVYKAVGSEKYINAIKKRALNKFPFKIPYKFNSWISSYIKPDTDILEKLAKEVDLDGFDVTKYHEAAIGKPIGCLPKNRQLYEYFNNESEISAYKLQDIVSKILGVEYLSPREMYPKNYLKIINFLESQGISDPFESDKIFGVISELVASKKMLDIDLIKIVRKRFLNIELTKDESSYLMTSRQNFEFSPKVLQEIYKETE